MRFLDRTWYESMQYCSFLSGYRVDERVDTDPEGLRRESYPVWYKRAYYWVIPHEDRLFEPPVHEDVVRRLAMFVSDSNNRVRRFCPEVMDLVKEPDLLAFNYLDKEQYDLLREAQDRWDRIYRERIEGCRLYEASCRPYMDPRVCRYMVLHDSNVDVIPGDDIILGPSGGFCVAHRIVLKDAMVVSGELPSRFMGLYMELGWEDGRYEFGFLAMADGELTEFTITCSDALFYDGEGVLMDVEDDPGQVTDNRSLLMGRDGSEWCRDEENRTYVRCKKIDVVDNVDLDPSTMTLRISGL